MILIQAIPKRVPKVKEQVRDDELLLYVNPNEEGLVLNRSAVAIWDMCDGTRSVREISRELEKFLGTQEGALLGDVQSTIEHLMAANVVRTVPVPGINTNDTTKEAAHSMPWSELARPMEDLSDLRFSMQRFSEIEPNAHVKYLQLSSEKGESTMLNGAIALRHIYKRLDDNVHNVGFDHPRIQEAEAWLSRWPLGLAQVRSWVRVLHPCLDQRFPHDSRGFMTGSCCHSSDEPKYMGTLWSTVNCSFLLAENLVHELAHQKLFAIGIRKEKTIGLIANDPKHGFRSPVITDRPRPMTALVHGVYAYMYVTAFNIAAVNAQPIGFVRDQLIRRLSVNLERIRSGREEIQNHLEADGNGAEYFRGFFSWLAELIDSADDLVKDSKSRGTAALVRSSEPVRIFVGTDPKQRRAEIALEASICKQTKGPIEITWMDYGRGGLWSDWEIGRARGDLPLNGGEGWATEFSGYRFALPEATNFQGRAIYLDVDMIALRDLRELFEIPMTHPWMQTPNSNSVILIDCSYFKGKSWWPKVDDMRKMIQVLKQCGKILQQQGIVGNLDESWNCLDGLKFSKETTGILHFTKRNTQPWRPYPEVFDYRPHAETAMEEIWWDAYLEGKGSRQERQEQTSAEALNYKSSSYCRSSPSPRHEELVNAFRDMHLRTGERFLGLKPASIYQGAGLLHHALDIETWIKELHVRTVLDYGAGKGLQYSLPLSKLSDLGVELSKELSDRQDGLDPTLVELWGIQSLACFDPAYPPFSNLPEGQFDAVICTDVLAHCSEQDLDWILREIFSKARKLVYATVTDRPGRRRLPSGENAVVTHHTAAWWAGRFCLAAEGFSNVKYRLQVGNLDIKKK